MEVFFSHKAVPLDGLSDSPYGLLGSLRLHRQLIREDFAKNFPERLVLTTSWKLERWPELDAIGLYARILTEDGPENVLSDEEPIVINTIPDVTLTGQFIAHAPWVGQSDANTGS